MDNKEKKVWFVTGASQGLGLCFCKELLESGYFVVGTSRNKSALDKEIQNHKERFLGLKVDLTDEKQVEKAIEQTVNHFGQIDVVVNNAGYGLGGSMEELTHQEVFDQFNVNVFSALHVIRHATPHLRKQKSGHIFNISSVAGISGSFPGFGSYSATKFAMNGFSESLHEELKPFGVHVTVVCPGYFRTNFLSKTSLSTPKNKIEDYKSVRETIKVHEEQINGNQAGDPKKAAKVLIQVYKMKEPPMYFLMGSDAYEMAGKKMQAFKTEIDANKELASSTNI